jgi:squalene-associated FAD-dependent desaturase
VKPVVVVGGGLSGLAAAVGLVAASIPVILCEQRPAAGGRAFSFRDRETGEVIDNGQHVLLAAYSRTMDFLSTIGTRGHLAIQPVPVLRFHHPTRGFRSFRMAALPSPLNLLGGAVTTDLFGAADRLRLLRAGARLASFDTDSPGSVALMTIEQWLDGAGQSEELKRSFWEPLATAIMNEHIERACATVFLHSLRRAFLGARSGGALAFPTVGLSELYVDAAIRYIEKKGGRVRLGTPVARLTSLGETVPSVHLAGGEEIGCSAVILAVPPQALPGLLPENRGTLRLIASAAAMPASPIVSVHLWFPEDFMHVESLGLIGRRMQWVFNRRMISLEGDKHGGHVSAVISAARACVGWTNEELIRAACEDLRSVFGPAVGPPDHAVVIREKRATFSCTPAVEATRPGPGTPFRNLFLAGDWTATGLPATIEGAIASGERCVDLVRHAVAAAE